MKIHQGLGCQEMIFVDIWGDQSSTLFMHIGRLCMALLELGHPFLPFCLPGRVACRGITPAVGLLYLPLSGFRQRDAQGSGLAEKRGQGA